MKKPVLSPVELKNVKLEDDFWVRWQELVRDVVIPYQYDILNDRIPDAEPSHAIENFRIAAGLAEGDFYGMVFQDSDVAKWLEGVAYVLAKEDNPDWSAKADEVIAIIAAAQEEDGYLDTHFQVAHPDKKWTNLREDHELYCAGHMIEAAVAYYEATGKDKILTVARKLADKIDSVFGLEDGKIPGYPGHEEIELALVRLYRVTGKERYLKLSQYFIDQRGQEPHYFELEAKQRGDIHVAKHHGFWDSRYNQSHLPVREQTTAEGHSVRAVYLYSAMADLALETGDETLKQACFDLWQNTTRRRMYVNGGIGSIAHGESFTIDYDLPPDYAYTETCAAIGLVFWAQRMLHLDMHSDYADVMERALFNGVISGISMDGKRFFYVNPLEVWPEAADFRSDKKHVKTERQGWFRCACCPPNVVRMVSSLEKYMYSQSSSELYVHLYAQSTAALQVTEQDIAIEQTTNYPWDGQIRLKLDMQAATSFGLNLRLPGWCRQPTLSVNGEAVDLTAVTNKGYARIERTWHSGDSILLDFPMQVEVLEANPQVRANAGKFALMRGPLLYCLEEIDNGACLPSISADPQQEFNVQLEPDLLGGVYTITGQGQKGSAEGWDDLLYRPLQSSEETVAIKAVPYYAWNNRGKGEMLVWVQKR